MSRASAGRARAGVVTPSWACGRTRGRITERMKKISTASIVSRPRSFQAIWLYLGFTLGLRDVEDLLAERGVAVSYETVRRWVNHFGPMIAADLRKRRLKPHTTWHPDEVYLKIDGRMVYLWRPVDAEVLDVAGPVQPQGIVMSGRRPLIRGWHRQLEGAAHARAASVRSAACQNAAILETSRQVAKARSREARRESAVAV